MIAINARRTVPMSAAGTPSTPIALTSSASGTSFALSARPRGVRWT